MSEIVIKAEAVSKQYRLGMVGSNTVKDDFKRWLYRVRGKEDPFLKIGESNDRSSKGISDYVWSLRDIDFEIQRGDSVGIIGRNGAGKSTLLKLLSQVTHPTTGRILTKGRIASLLEVGTGFHPEMTGRENIYLNGAILGMRKHEIKRKFDEIVAFSGVERYIDTPVKRYSSGMYVRLAFAVAAHLESEILIVDEVLAVGDADFQKKCLGKMGDVSKGEGRTVLFVSHNMAAVKSLCNKGILLEHGNIVANGNVDSVLARYQNSSFNEAGYESGSVVKELYFNRIYFTSHTSNFYCEESISVRFEVETTITFSANKFIIVRVLDNLDQALFSCETPLIFGKKDYELVIPKRTLTKGYYKLNAIIYHPAIAQYDVVDFCCNFAILDTIEEFGHLESFDIGKLYIPHQWK